MKRFFFLPMLITSCLTSFSQNGGVAFVRHQQRAVVEASNDHDGKQYYTVISRAYFHDEPDPDTKREGVYLTHWTNARLTPIEEANGFIYVIFRNYLSQVTKGWLRKSDLKLASQMTKEFKKLGSKPAANNSFAKAGLKEADET